MKSIFEKYSKVATINLTSSMGPRDNNNSKSLPHVTVTAEDEPRKEGVYSAIDELKKSMRSESQSSLKDRFR